MQFYHGMLNHPVKHWIVLVFDYICGQTIFVSILLENDGGPIEFNSIVKLFHRLLYSSLSIKPSLFSIKFIFQAHCKQQELLQFFFIILSTSQVIEFDVHGKVFVFHLKKYGSVYSYENLRHI